MAALFRRTRELLDIACTTDLPDSATELLAKETLPYVEDIEEGFRVWLRAGAEESPCCVRSLLAPASTATAGHAGREPRRADRGDERDCPELVAAGDRAGAARAIAALHNARLVFAMLPSTPAEDVHYPSGRRTYADILPPRSPAELAERIEELERSLWAVATRRSRRLTDGSYRRTYGFFDTAARLSGNHFLTA